MGRVGHVLGSSEAGQKMKAVEGWNPDCYFANADPCQLEGTNESAFNGVPLVTETISASLYRLALVLVWSATVDPNPTSATSNLIPMNWAQTRLTPIAVTPSAASKIPSNSVKST